MVERCGERESCKPQLSEFGTVMVVQKLCKNRRTCYISRKDATVVKSVESIPHWLREYLLSPYMTLNNSHFVN